MTGFAILLLAGMGLTDATATATFDGRSVPVETCRVSAVPMNRVWPGRQRPLSQTKTAWFVTFDVTKPGEFAWRIPAKASEVRVHPFHRGGYRVEGGVFRTRIERPEQFVIEAGGSEMHVFADAPWRYAKRPGDRYFGPGVHEAGAIVPKSGERIVIDRGATVYGNLVLLGVTNVTVEGRGILDTSRIAREDPAWPGTRAVAACRLDGVKSTWGTAPVYAYKCGGISISGIVFRDAPRWTMNVCDSSDVAIDGVKLVGMWRYNADGIDLCACERSVIRNSFIRSFDDCVIARPQLRAVETTPMRDLVVSNCVLWCDWGAAMKVQHGQYACEMADLRFRDIDCLRTDWTAVTVTTRWGSNGCVIGGVSFDDIRIDAPADRVCQQYQRGEDDVFTPVCDPNVTLVDVGAYSLGTPAPNQGTPGQRDPAFFRIDYLDLAFRNFQVYDQPGHRLSRGSPIRPSVCARAELPRFQIRDLVLEGMPEGTTISLVGNVNRLEPTLADPSIARDGSRYLMVGTENRLSEGKPFKGDAVFPLFESVDLKNWRAARAPYAGGRILARSDAIGTDNFWAPQLFHRGNRWFFAYTASHHWGLASAERPEGPFKPYAEFPKGKGRIDPHVFFDDDGRIWATFSDWALGGIGVVELTDDMKAFRHDPVLAVRNDRPWERQPLDRYFVHLNAAMGYTMSDWTAFHSNTVTVEGPTLVKRGGQYVLFYSANDFRSPYYCVCAAVANSPLGPWRKIQQGPVISRLDTKLNGTGHGDVFSDEKGRLWYVFHYHNSPVRISPRRTGIIRLEETFAADGTPRYRADADSVFLAGYSDL